MNLEWPNVAHWHLIVNHAPIFGFVFAFLVLLLSEFSSCSSWRKVGWFLTILSAALIYLAYETGENAHDMVSKLVGVSHNQIDAHLQKAQMAAWCGGITGALALIAFIAEWVKNNCLIRPLRLIILLGVFASLVFFQFTAYEGGLIRHPEIMETPPPSQEQIQDKQKPHDHGHHEH